MRYFLKAVSIEGFRGINNDGAPLILNFKTKAVNSIFAFNASGKSSIFEAIQFVVTGEIPKLANLDSTENANTYYVNCFHSSALATVKLTLEPSDGSDVFTLTVTRNRDGVTNLKSSHASHDASTIVASLKSEAVFLDQTTFNKFVSESPLERGRSFSSLIGLAKLSEYRQILEVLALSRNLNTDLELDTLDAQLRALEEGDRTNEAIIASSVEHLTGVKWERNSPADVLGNAALFSLSKSPILEPLVEGRKFADLDFEALNQTLRETEKADERERLAVLLSEQASLQAMTSVENEQADFEALTLAVRSYTEQLQQVGSDAMRTLYTAELAVISADSWSEKTICPACDAGQQADLESRVKEKLSRYASVDDARKAVTDLWEHSPWVQRLRKLEESDLLGLPLGERYASIADVCMRRESPTIDTLNLAWRKLSQFEEMRASLTRQKDVDANEIRAALPDSLVVLTERLAYARQLNDALALRMSLRSRLSEKLEVRARRERWRLFISQAARVFAAAESKLSVDRTLALETDFRMLYSRIMRNQDIAPKLVKSGEGAHLHLRLEKFYDQSDHSSNALLSESYRNAFAIAIFLSAARTPNSAARFMILDDVTSSFDAGHQFNLMQLLRTTFAYPADAAGPQVIILSHDGLLQKYFDKVSDQPDWHHTRLKGNAPKGILMGDTYDSNRLRASAVSALDAGNVETAESYIRQYLEFRLMQIIQKVNIPVPVDFAIRDDRQMVGNSLDAISSAIALHSDAQRLILSSQQEIGARSTYVTQIVANWVSHYATGALGSFAPQVLRDVIDDIDAYVDCFRYPCTCNSASPQPRFYRDLSGKSCQC